MSRWMDKHMIYANKLFRWGDNLIEQRCPYCFKYCTRIYGYKEYDFCPHCGKKVEDGETND